MDTQKILDNLIAGKLKVGSVYQLKGGIRLHILTQDQIAITANGHSVRRYHRSQPLVPMVDKKLVDHIE